MAQFGGPKLVKELHFDEQAKNKLTLGIEFVFIENVDKKFLVLASTSAPFPF